MSRTNLETKGNQEKLDWLKSTKLSKAISRTMQTKFKETLSETN